MDTDLKKILAELPIKPPRSRLEPYREFIEELRSRGRTYRDIAEILAEKCGLHVTASGVHDFRADPDARERQVGWTCHQIESSSTQQASGCGDFARVGIQRGRTAQDRGTKSA